MYICKCLCIQIKPDICMHTCIYRSNLMLQTKSNVPPNKNVLELTDKGWNTISECPEFLYSFNMSIQSLYNFVSDMQWQHLVGSLSC